MGWDSAVSNNTTNIFSDKLIMFHVSAMIAAGIGNFGMSMAASPRRDLGLKYASLIPEILLYAEDGANIMIKHGWMEEPPQADDRDQLIQQLISSVGRVYLIRGRLFIMPQHIQEIRSC